MVNLPFDEVTVLGTNFRALTFNIRNPFKDKDCHDWRYRREYLVRSLRRVRKNDRELATASIMCLQNTSEKQRVFLQEQLGFHYKTDGKNLVSWNPELWDLKDEDGLGFGPEYGLTNLKTLLPGSGNRRMITVFLQNKQTLEVIAATSTELNSGLIDVFNRGKQARAVLRELENLGDNQILGISAHRTSGIGLSDVWTDATESQDVPVDGREYKSKHDWRTLKKGKRTDFLYIGPGLRARYAYNIDTSRECDSPSNHTIISVGLGFALTKEPYNE